MKVIFPFFMSIMIPFLSYAQQDNVEVIDAQRPTLTESYSIITPNKLQFENGVDYFNHLSGVHFTTFLRGSITNKIELRVATDYTSLNTAGVKFMMMNPENTTYGIGTSFIYNRDLVSNKNDFRLAMSKSFKNIFVNYNLGYIDNFYNIFLIGTPIGSMFEYFIEYYNDSVLNRIHTGITWIPHKDVQFDINGGWMDTDSWYAGLGVSFRIR